MASNPVAFMTFNPLYWITPVGFFFRRNHSRLLLLLSIARKGWSAEYSIPAKNGVSDSKCFWMKRMDENTILSSMNGSILRRISHEKNMLWKNWPELRLVTKLSSPSFSNFRYKSRHLFLNVKAVEDLYSTPSSPYFSSSCRTRTSKNCCKQDFKK